MRASLSLHVNKLVSKITTAPNMGLLLFGLKQFVVGG